MKKALVTGGAGFIGSSLTIKLIESGWKVDVVDNMSTGHESTFVELQRSSDVVSCYRTCYGSYTTRQMIEEEKYDVVFHVGAIPRVLYSVEHPAETHDNNVGAMIRMLEACRGNVGRVVFSSSSAVLGGTPDMTYPTHELYDRMPLSPYAAQKASGEDYCRMFSELYSLDTVNLRYFNVYGPRQLGDSPYSTVISAWCQAIHDGKRLRLDGDGSASRDFCYIDNVVQANMLAAEAGRRFVGEPINVAHGEEHSVIEVLGMFRDRFGELEITYAPPRPGDAQRTWADIGRARALLGYEPTTTFKDGLELTWNWWNI